VVSGRSTLGSLEASLKTLEQTSEPLAFESSSRSLIRPVREREALAFCTLKKDCLDVVSSVAKAVSAYKIVLAFQFS
jgi:hypothetical protein